MAKGQLTREPTIHDNALLVNSYLGQWTEIGTNNQWENVKFGDYSYTAGYNLLQNAIIGKYVNIAWGVRIGPTKHPMDRPTLHHFTYRRQMYGFGDCDDQGFFQWRKEQVVEIGNDVWLGHNAIIMPGVMIGDGAIIGSGAVVTKNVAPYTVVGGVPARFLKQRFASDIAEALQKIRWWDWSHEIIKERIIDFSGDVQSFIAKYGAE